MNYKEELEDGYYWVSFSGDIKVPVERYNGQFYCFGVGNEINTIDFEVLGKVSNTIETI